jgi:hypothetical protein
MLAGHFGLAAAARSRAPKAPLAALLGATFLLDIGLAVLAPIGIEGFTILGEGSPQYGGIIVHGYYTHSLVGAAILACLALALGTWMWGLRAGVVMGLLVLSHWVLDLVMHLPDLPILPGNYLDLPLLGFGLWADPAWSAAAELALVVGGIVLYARYAFGLVRVTGVEKPSGRRRAILAVAVIAALLLALLLLDVLGQQTGAMFVIAALLVLGGWIDHRLLGAEMIHSRGVRGIRMFQGSKHGDTETS